MYLFPLERFLACSDYIFCCYFSVLFLNAHQIDNNYLCPRSFSESFKILFERLSYFSVANSDLINSVHMIDTGIKVAFNARRVKHALRIYLLLVSHWRL